MVDIPRPRPAESDAADEVWALVEQAKAGDSDAFAQVYRRYLDKVFRYIYFRVNNRQVAEDLTAETFLRAFKRIGSVKWQGLDLGAWLVTIARNLVADYFKSGRYRFEVSTGDVLEPDGPAERGVNAADHNVGNPESAFLEYVSQLELLRAVNLLNPDQRECVALRYLMQHSVAETALAMNTTEGAIKAMTFRAIRNLRRHMAKSQSQPRTRPSSAART